MQYTLTKYLTADYLRENDFLKAYLELVDEIIFCCSMESLDVLSNMSFESMDDNYFLAYQNFFLNGLSTYDINKLDKLVLSEWFSLLHVRGELSDIDKLLKFGGSLKNKEKNVFELYHNADVPNQPIDTTKDGLIYLITENNIDLDSDYFINQQVPAGYRIGLMRTPPPKHVKSGDVIYLGTKETDFVIHVKSGDKIILNKKFEGDITFYRRRQFDQYYTFGQVYRSQYTINQLSQYHQKGFYFFGFELDHTVPLPVEYHTNETVFGGGVGTYGEYYIGSGTITIPPEPSHEQYSFYVLDENGNIVNSSRSEIGWLEPSLWCLPSSTMRHIIEAVGLLGYMYDDIPVTIDTDPLTFGATLYQANVRNVILKNASNEYTINHVLSAEGVINDEALSQLYFRDDVPFLCVRMNPGTYSSTTIYAIDYTETPPPLPTVTSDTAYASTSSRVSVPSGSSVNLYSTLYDSSSTIPYDSTKSYGGRVGDGDGGVSRWQFSFINNGGYLAIKNTTSASIYAFGVSYYICSSNQAEIVFVLNSSDVKEQAFKYTQNGTDYYYVLDGTQSDWTDDLSSIGYHLPLPDVSNVNNFGGYNWLHTSINAAESIISGGNTSNLQYVDNGETYTPDYDSSKSYGIIQWQQVGGTTAGRTEFEIVNASGKMQAKNISNDTLLFYQAKVAVCSSNQANVVTVYDLSNVAFNAFKYTQNGTDYYYVLDGTQSDWTDDLSSIGYSLEPAHEQLVMVYIESGNLYFQNSVKNDTSKNNSNCYGLYSDDTRTTPYVFDWGKRYVFGNVVNGEFRPAAVQTQAQFPSTTGANTGYSICVNKRNSSDTSGYLWLAYNSYTSGSVSYPPRYLMIYDDAMSAWFNNNHTDESIPAGFNITTDFDYDSSKTYNVLAFVNANGIKVNDEYLYGISFSENSGKVKITLINWTSSIAQAARIVFYAE